MEADIEMSVAYSGPCHKSMMKFPLKQYTAKRFIKSRLWHTAKRFDETRLWHTAKRFNKTRLWHTAKRFDKTTLWHRCFPVNFVKFLRTPSLQNPSRRLLLFLPFYLYIPSYIFHTNCFCQLLFFLK